MARQKKTEEVKDPTSPPAKKKAKKKTTKKAKADLPPEVEVVETIAKEEPVSEEEPATLEEKPVRAVKPKKPSKKDITNATFFARSFHRLFFDVFNLILGLFGYRCKVDDDDIEDLAEVGGEWLAWELKQKGIEIPAWMHYAVTLGRVCVTSVEKIPANELPEESESEALGLLPEPA